MKMFIALLTCGLAVCTLAARPCSDEEANQCEKRPSDVTYDLVDTYPKDAEELDRICPNILSMLDCKIEFSGRCPNTLTAAFSDVWTDYKTVFDKICVDSNPIRQKYLESIPCLNQEVSGLRKGCEASITGLGYCEEKAAVGECIKKGVSEKCGKEAHRVFSNLYKAQESQTEVFCRVNFF